MSGPTTARHSHPSLFLVIGLLCFCLTAQILGAPTSFWDMNMNEAPDLVTSSLLEGFSLPLTGLDFSIVPHRALYSPSVSHEHNLLLVRSFFHPPITHA